MKNFVFLLTTCALMTAGCEKKPAATAVDKEATTESKTGTLSKFQKKLVDTEITDWEPTSNSGAQFIYKTLGFNADGTWTASGVVKADFEEFECTQKAVLGQWSGNECHVRYNRLGCQRDRLHFSGSWHKYPNLDGLLGRRLSNLIPIAIAPARETRCLVLESHRAHRTRCRHHTLRLHPRDTGSTS